MHEIKGGKIAKVTADVANETAALGGAAAPKVIDTIVANNGTVGVDAVTGATMTSQAILDAVTECLMQAK